MDTKTELGMYYPYNLQAKKPPNNHLATKYSCNMHYLNNQTQDITSYSNVYTHP